MASGIGTSVALATSRTASAHWSQVAFSPGIATPACSNRVLLTNGPVTVSWVMKPGRALLPSGRIQSR